MSNIEAIRNTISKELQWLNSLMHDVLVSDNAFLNNIIDENLKKTGKQIRPILVILGAEVTAEANETVISAAAAIELLHNASLIHDDVLDESAKRRGVPTINFLWDNQVAVLVGDYFVSRALRCATDTGKIEIVRTMSKLGTDLSIGEIDQIDHARKRTIREESYFEIIKLKTASLFRSCMEVGCYAVEADKHTTEVLSKYAELLGLCFQIRDDIFDYYDNTTALGKPTGNDLREGKVTLPLIHALESDKTAERNEMITLLDKDYLETEDIQKLVDYAKRHDGIEYAYGKMTEIRRQASELVSMIPDCKAIRSLEAIFDYTIERNF
ncbi:MAG: polyprenyl synthetase family protein [Muribaculaceae bacterium]|nr:polyprenyl synthetase family protein [Muribaculaceae bacterium]